MLVKYEGLIAPECLLLFLQAFCYKNWKINFGCEEFFWTLKCSPHVSIIHMMKLGGLTRRWGGIQGHTTCSNGQRTPESDFLLGLLSESVPDAHRAERHELWAGSQLGCLPAKSPSVTISLMEAASICQKGWLCIINYISIVKYFLIDLAAFNFYHKEIFFFQFLHL